MDDIFDGIVDDEQPVAKPEVKKGRPPKSTGRKGTQIVVRLEEHQHEAISKAAQLSNLSVSEWAREVLEELAYAQIKSIDPNAYLSDYSEAERAKRRRLLVDRLLGIPSSFVD